MAHETLCLQDLLFCVELSIQKEVFLVLNTESDLDFVSLL